MPPAPACPRCGEALAGAETTSPACAACGARFAGRRLEVAVAESRKVAGVGRHRYVLRGAQGGDPVAFEGPPGLPLSPGTDVLVLSRDGSPVALHVAGRTVGLAAAPSEPGGAPATPGHVATSAAAWLLLVAALLAAACCLDAGTLSSGRWP